MKTRRMVTGRQTRFERDHLPRWKHCFCTRFATRFATILHINRITVGCATVASIVRVVSAQTRSTIIMVFCLSLAKGRVNDAQLRCPAKDPRVTLFVSYCAVNNRSGDAMAILSRG